jgi:hypothetical protein
LAIVQAVNGLSVYGEFLRRPWDGDSG